MTTPLSPLQAILLAPVVFGSVYGVACVLAFVRFAALARRPASRPETWPRVTVLKPVHGLEKGLEGNLRSTCVQDYPDYHVVFSVQEAADPALPLLRQLEREFGAQRVTLAIGDHPDVPNGKIRNLLGALAGARHDTLVISDSDVRVPPDYLRTIVAPLEDPGVGCVCTLYRAVGAESWYERMELLTFNADFVPNLVFAHVTGVAHFVLGASTALTRATLAAIGGLAALGDYLVEDFEMGRRIRASGRRVVIVPRFVDTIVDLKSPRRWWEHQVYWDQNTRSANPIGLFATILIRAVPFALFFAIARGLDAPGLGVLGSAVALRVATATAVLWGLRDAVGLRSVALLPVRDLAGFVSWVLAFVQPEVVWRGESYGLTRGGRMVPRPPAA